MGKGRPGKYETNVEPYLEKISQMCLDMTEEQIAKSLHINYSTFRKYKKTYKALSDALKKGKRELATELKSSLIQKAKGFGYIEKKEIKQNGVVVREEVYHKKALPDVAAINLLLKNIDPEWANDPQLLELRKEEIRLQKERIEKDNW